MIFSYRIVPDEIATKGWLSEDNTAKAYFDEIHRYEFDAKTTIKAFIDYVVHNAPVNSLTAPEEVRNCVNNNWYNNSFSIYLNNENRSIIYSDDVTLFQFQRFLKAEERTVEIHWLLFDHFGKGDVYRNQGEYIGVRFYFHSDENVHLYDPHVHVFDIGSDGELYVPLFPHPVSVRIESGTFNSKRKKKALQFIDENWSSFVKYWNEKTNGIDADFSA